MTHEHQRPTSWAEYGASNPFDDLQALVDELQSQENHHQPHQILMGLGPYGIIRFPSDMAKLCKFVQSRIPLGVHFKALCIGGRSSGWWRSRLLRMGLWLLSKAGVEIYSDESLEVME
jgi:hypothetical protein